MCQPREHDAAMTTPAKLDASKRPLIFENEWTSIKASVIAARQKLCHQCFKRELYSWEKLLAPYCPAPILPYYPGANEDDNRREFLWDLASSSKRGLNTENAIRAIQLAYQTDDADFFIRLGKALTLAPLSPQIVSDCRIQNLLLSEWVRRNSRRPLMAYFLRFLPLADAPKDQVPLCFFTNPALADYCRIKLNQSNLTDHAVIKSRQRLGLLRANQRTIRTVQLRKAVLLYI